MYYFFYFFTTPSNINNINSYFSIIKREEITTEDVDKGDNSGDDVVLCVAN